MQEFHLQHSCGTSSSSAAHLAEPSALDGILSERFCCGPELTSTQQQDPYYSSELGQVFFPPNAWPHQQLPELQPHMLQCYSQCDVIAAALMRLFAAALGMDPHYFDASLTRHHSNMQVRHRHSTLALEVTHRQLCLFRKPTRGSFSKSYAKRRHKLHQPDARQQLVSSSSVCTVHTQLKLWPSNARCYRCAVINTCMWAHLQLSLNHCRRFRLCHCFHSVVRQVANYPSQLQDPGHSNPRKKAHVDSGTLTLLASEDWLPGSSWQAGDGGLQLLTPQQEWLEVQVPQREWHS